MSVPFFFPQMFFHSVEILQVCFHILILVEIDISTYKHGTLSTHIPQSKIISAILDCGIATFFMSAKQIVKIAAPLV